MPIIPRALNASSLYTFGLLFKFKIHLGKIRILTEKSAWAGRNEVILWFG